MKASLLIDWENFAARLSGDPYWRSDLTPLVSDLVQAVEADAAGNEAALTEKHYFVSANTDIGTPTRKALTNAGFTRVEGTTAKNAADTRLIVYATRQREAGFDVFYVVTGDEDFADLAIELERVGAVCFLCPVDDTRLRGPIADWKHKLLVKGGLIPLPPGTPPPAKELDQFVLCLQSLSDGGHHLGDWNAAVSAIADRYGFGGVSGVKTLMQTATDEGLIWEGNVVINGEARHRRRLRYESIKLMRLLDAADHMLEEITRKRGTASHGELLNAISAELKVEYAALPEMMVKAGYLDRAGQSFTVASAHANYGIVRALRRIALTVWHEQLQNPNRVGVSPGRIHERWVRHVFAGQTRDLPAEKRAQAMEEGRAMVKRARASGVLLETGGRGGSGPFGYVVHDDHPIVETVVAVAKVVWDLLPSDLSSIDRTQLLDQLAEAAATTPALGSTERGHRFWLGALASALVIHTAQGRVMRSKNTVLRRHWP
jgi:NYN domain